MTVEIAKKRTSKVDDIVATSNEGETSCSKTNPGSGEKPSPLLFSSVDSEDISIPLSGFVTEKSNNIYAFKCQLKYLNNKTYCKTNTYSFHNMQMLIHAQKRKYQKLVMTSLLQVSTHQLKLNWMHQR